MKFEDKEKELLFSLTKEDFEITYFSGSGAGGQHRNRHNNCVRIKHKESGIIAICQDERSLKENKEKAFERLCNDKTFRRWLSFRASQEIINKRGEETVEEKLKKMLSPIHLKIEIVNEKGEWELEK